MNIDKKRIHKYWTIDDKKLLDNCKSGLKDFFTFIETIEKFLSDIKA